MDNKKRARPDVAAPGQATEKAAFDEAAIPYIDISSKNSEKQAGIIESLLLHGADNAIPSAELARLAGCSSVRQLQDRIAEERDVGAVILSTCRNGGGYYLPDDGAAGRREIEAYIQTLTARASHTFGALKSARRALDDLEGQEVFKDV